MSLLMEALKQAEHAKHSAQTETPPPETAAPPMLAPTLEADISASLSELSLTPVAAADDAAAPADNALELDTAPSLQLAMSPTPEIREVPAPVAVQHNSAAEAEPALISIALAPGTADTNGNGHSHNSPEAAARILAVSAAQHAALRRRNLLGAIGLGSVLVVALGSYYYYATLAQQTPFLSLPQPPSAAATAPDETVTDSASAITADTSAGMTNDIPAGTTSDTPVDTELDAALPTTAANTQTPWQEGPPPAAPANAQDWEPAPVDPRVLRGEQPAAYTEADETVTAPSAAIKITRSTQPNRVSVDLQTAYNDFQTGRLTQADAGYRQVLARDANNRDAQMGLAAIAVRNNQLPAARDYYRAILQRNPKDSTAQAALSDLGQDRPANSESQLKSLLAEQPQSAQLHFALANLYAEQQRWPYAQQAYFEAQRLSPEHPDYAFNLAVSLEHLGQARVALEYYRRALMLAGPHNAQFDLNIAQQRINALSVQGQP